MWNHVFFQKKIRTTNDSVCKLRWCSDCSLLFNKLLTTEWSCRVERLWKDSWVQYDVQARGGGYRCHWLSRARQSSLIICKPRPFRWLAISQPMAACLRDNVRGYSGWEMLDGYGWCTRVTSSMMLPRWATKSHCGVAFPERQMCVSCGTVEVALTDRF